MCGVGRDRERGSRTTILAALIFLIVCFVLFLVRYILLFRFGLVFRRDSEAQRVWGGAKA